ncbi:MAG: hypothetical protein H6942_07055 [Candidatus Accumulibacter sp.]|uniref:hypothetical protein n=1 Tax=Accumulibacter sp. TaxID=2053492 RepID=UPI0019FD9854|nr:hypothetical protein [Accumulibacter sp.]MBE2259950.1 hypothetical protein [Paracoccaceae bacterium]MCB1942191.1 hypothetical protein [Accumulibacter sp.]MCP5248283.1 hypothetical protein [Accumulibacter sp.]
MPDSYFKLLPWTRLRRGVPCYLPKPASRPSVDVNSPALEVMIDFRRLTPVTIARDASLDEANRVMTLCKAHYLLVSDGQQLLGIVTEAGTRGHRPLATAHAKGIRPGELVVGDVMINKHDDAEVMHLKDVVGAKVGNVVATLKELATPNCLVVEHDENDNHVLCGVFLLAQIERQLGRDPQTDEVAHTFSQVVSSLGR